jgi:hypothetical protein
MSAECTILLQRHRFAQRQQVSIERCKQQTGAEAYECLLDDVRLVQGYMDVCLRSINIQLYCMRKKKELIDKPCSQHKHETQMSDNTLVQKDNKHLFKDKWIAIWRCICLHKDVWPTLPSEKCHYLFMMAHSDEIYVHPSIQ